MKLGDYLQRTGQVDQLNIRPAVQDYSEIQRGIKDHVRYRTIDTVDLRLAPEQPEETLNRAQVVELVSNILEVPLVEVSKELDKKLKPRQKLTVEFHDDEVEISKWGTKDGVPIVFTFKVLPFKQLDRSTGEMVEKNSLRFWNRSDKPDPRRLDVQVKNMSGSRKLA